MSEAQFVAILVAAPFLALTITYGIGLFVLDRAERKAIRAIKRELHK
jgi:hypothetical protein